MVGEGEGSLAVAGWAAERGVRLATEAGSVELAARGAAGGGSCIEQ